MSRREKGPRLWLRKQRTCSDGSVRQALWYIKDGPIIASTGCGKDNLDGARAALFAYLRSKSPEQAMVDYGRTRCINPQAFGPNEVVYFIQCGSNVKIGHTTDLQLRMQSLQCANPHPLTLLGTMRGGLREEIDLHRRFSKDRGIGEWFQITNELMAFIKLEADVP